MKQRCKRGELLGQPQKQRTADRQHGAGTQHDLCVHGIAFPRETLAAHFADHQKADAAEDDQRAGDKVQRDIVPERRKIPPAAEDVKAGVVECGNGVKQADADRFSDGVMPHKGRSSVLRRKAQ